MKHFWKRNVNIQLAGTSNLQFYLISKGNTTSVSRNSLIKDDEGFKKFILEPKNRMVSNDAERTYVSLMLSFPASKVRSDKLTRDNVDLYKKSVRLNYSRYFLIFKQATSQDTIRELVGGNSSSAVHVCTPDSVVLDQEGDLDPYGTSFVEDLQSPDVAPEKGVAGVKSVTTSSAFGRIVGILNTTVGSPYYHSMTDVMARVWIDYLVAFRSKDFNMSDQSISPVELFTAGYLESRN